MIEANDYVGHDSEEATMTVLRVEGDRALCAWFEGGDAEGEAREAWFPLGELSLLQKAIRRPGA